MKTKHIDRDNQGRSAILTNADLDGENKCVMEWIDCIENEDGELICKTIKNNCLDDAIHTLVDL